MMKPMPKPQHLHVNIRHEDDAFWATVDEFPGVLATGDDLDELRESLQEGIALILARPGEDPPAVALGTLHLEPVAIAAGAELVYA
jgi:predicted RNase H-like HicB family nuclease